eukprot:TRINITY_DN9735_c0_g4_i1.p5 TRINITY_DN9735_c0_g4~~TRINITY_DN9735_c0_g4_i1.p5  ORF type:complete len:112 (-),score=12.98 TRINITY_DN9735_c0_g4_i1:177-512(-)
MVYEPSQSSFFCYSSPPVIHYYGQDQVVGSVVQFPSQHWQYVQNCYNNAMLQQQQIQLQQFQQQQQQQQIQQQQQQFQQIQVQNQFYPPAMQIFPGQIYPQFYGGYFVREM